MDHLLSIEKTVAQIQAVLGCTQTDFVTVLSHLLTIHILGLVPSLYRQGSTLNYTEGPYHHPVVKVTLTLRYKEGFLCEEIEHDLRHMVQFCGTAIPDRERSVVRIHSGVVTCYLIMADGK